MKSPKEKSYLCTVIVTSIYKVSIVAHSENEAKDIAVEYLENSIGIDESNLEDSTFCCDEVGEE